MDTIIYEKDTRKVIAILTDTDCRDKEYVALKDIEIETVSSYNRNLLVDELTGDVTFKDKSNIIYFEDYIGRNK